MMSEAHAKYRQTEKGKATIKAARKRWNKSEKGIEYRKRKRREYMETEKGKAARKRQGAARNARIMAAKRAIQAVEKKPEKKIKLMQPSIVPRVPTLAEMLEAANRPRKAPTRNKAKRESEAIRYAKILAHLANCSDNRERIAKATKINPNTLHTDLVNLEYAGRVDGQRNGAHITWSLAAE